MFILEEESRVKGRL